MKVIKPPTAKATRKADARLIKDAARNKGEARRRLLERVVAAADLRVDARPGDVVDVDLPSGRRTMRVRQGGRLQPLEWDDERPLIVSERQASDLRRLGVADGFVVEEPAR